MLHFTYPFRTSLAVTYSLSNNIGRVYKLNLILFSSVSKIFKTLFSEMICYSPISLTLETKREVSSVLHNWLSQYLSQWLCFCSLPNCRCHEISNCPASSFLFNCFLCHDWETKAAHCLRPRTALCIQSGDEWSGDNKTIR